MFSSKFDFVGLEIPKSKLIYIEVNEKIEKQTGMLYIALLKVTLPATMLPNFILSFLIYFTTDSESQAFLLVFPIWLPFDWRTPVGYLIAFAIEFAAFSCILIASNCLMGFLIGSTEMLMAIVVDIKEALNTLNDGYKTEKNPLKLKQSICDFVQFHADTTQLSEQENRFGEEIT